MSYSNGVEMFGIKNNKSLNHTLRTQELVDCIVREPNLFGSINVIKEDIGFFRMGWLVTN